MIECRCCVTLQLYLITVLNVLYFNFNLSELFVILVSKLSK